MGKTQNSLFNNNNGQKKSLKRNNELLSDYTLGKLPPQNVQLEESVLGSLLVEHETYDTVSFLQPEMFYMPKHAEIFRAIQELKLEKKPFDILIVSEKLTKYGKLEEVGGIYALSILTNKIASSAKIEEHARIVQQHHLEREVIRVSSEMMKLAYSQTEDTFVLLEIWQREVGKVINQIGGGNSNRLVDALQKTFAQITERMNHKGSIFGIDTGYRELNELTGGWQKGDFIIVAGRPSMGKTAAVLNFARNAAVHSKAKVAVFSLEMSTVQLVTRLISAEAEVDSYKLRNGNLTEEELQQLYKSTSLIEEADIILDDTPAISILELSSSAKRLKAKYGLDMIIIDYLQLMSGSKSGGDGNREQEISYISRSLKGLAKELDIPVIALSQINRGVESRGGDKRPNLSDLRESGSIEQDADMVIFLYRPEYYGITESPTGDSNLGIAEFLIKKQRQGSLGDVIVKFIPQYTKFVDLEPIPPMSMPSNSTFLTANQSFNNSLNKTNEPPLANKTNDMPKGKEEDFF